MEQNYVPASNWLTRGQHWTLLEVAEWLLLMHAQSVWALGTGTTNERAIYSRSECRAHGTSTLHSQTVAPAAAISLIALCDYMRQALIVIASQSTTRRNVYGL